MPRTPTIVPTPDAPLNPDAISPLYAPWEEPLAHRPRADAPGKPAAEKRPVFPPRLNVKHAKVVLP